MADKRKSERDLTERAASSPDEQDDTARDESPEPGTASEAEDTADEAAASPEPTAKADGANGRRLRTGGKRKHSGRKLSALTDTRPAPEPGDTEEANAGRRNVVLALLSGVALGAAGGFAGGYFFARRKKRPAPKDTGPLPRVFAEISSFNLRKGPNPAKVTIVEFSDFQ